MVFEVTHAQEAPMVIVSTFAVVLSGCVCQAQSATNTTGRLLASNSAQCHGSDETAAGFESLFGKSADKLFNELREIHSQTLMRQAAVLLSDQSRLRPVSPTGLGS